MSIHKYILTGFDVSTYCKSTRIIQDNKTSWTISFGATNYYCIVMSISPDTPTEAHIDRLESNEKCIDEGKTICFVKIALWTIKSKFPHITRCTLNDDSHIDCTKGIKTHKLNVAYDYILKYNTTWYEKQFKAQLPTDIMKLYKDRLLLLDKPLQAYEIMKDIVYEIQKYRQEYKNAKSPREFMNTLREKYKSDYCCEVSTWLTSYMTSLRINIFQQQWYIHISDINEPTNYTIQETEDAICEDYTSVNKTENIYNASVFGHYQEGHSLGTYDAFE